jgi:hypothetical protein
MSFISMNRVKMVTLLNEAIIYTKDENTRGLLKKILSLSFEEPDIVKAVLEMKDYLSETDNYNETPQYRKP